MSVRNALTGAVWLGATLLLSSESIRGQSIRGHVMDATTGDPVVNAEVVALGPNAESVSAVSNAGGRFIIRLPSAGRWTVGASSLGYLASPPVDVELEGSWQQVEVIVRLSSAPLELEGITVVARGMELRHRASWAGFRERHENALAVGPNRIVTREDGPMKGVFDLADVMRWFPDPNRCVAYFIDGRFTLFIDSPSNITMIDYEGVEFYRSYRDAPLEYKDIGPCVGSPDYSIVALWSTREGGG